VGFNLGSNVWKVPKASSFCDFVVELQSARCDKNCPAAEFDCDGGHQFTFECLQRSKIELVC
jgi:hypothetical protein